MKTAEFAPEVYKEQGVSGGKSKSSKVNVSNRVVGSGSRDIVEIVDYSIEPRKVDSLRPGSSFKVLEK